MSSISPIGGSTGITPIQMPTFNGTTETQNTSSSNFGSSIAGALNGLQSTTANSDNLAAQMATGKLSDVQDYMIAANQTEIATQLTVAVRNKAVDAFNQIMNMSM